MWKQNGLQEIYEAKRRNRMHLPVTNRLASVEADEFKREIELYPIRFVDTLSERLFPPQGGSSQY